VSLLIVFACLEKDGDLCIYRSSLLGGILP
jgi:hypothetical protein